MMKNKNIHGISRKASALLVLITICLLSATAPATTWHVAIGGTDISGGGTVGAPFATVGFAASQAADNDTISVGPGLFVGNGNRDLLFSERSLTLLSPGGPDATTFDCEGSSVSKHRAISFGSGVDSTFKVIGITFRNGNDSLGGLINISDGARPTFENCRFELGKAFDGGAVYFDSAGGQFTDCKFGGNISGNLGGAIFVEVGSDARFTSCDFLGNSSENYAGAVMIGLNAAAQFTDCLFAETGATWGGGMLYASGATIDFSGCTFVKSAATWTGDVMAFTNSTVTLQNSLLHTVAGSEAIVCLGSSSIAISCSNIFSTQYTGWFGACITPQFGSNGNISEEPQFFNYDGGDFRVKATSPCAPENNSCSLLIGSEEVFPAEDDCGDLDGDGIVSISDAVYGINYIFANGPAPHDSHNGDIDCSGLLIITDCVYLVNYIFAGGDAPCAGCR